MSKNPFKVHNDKPTTLDGIYSQAEVGLANRNSGVLLETLALDITPIGSHYLLNHFDVPLLDAENHRLKFSGSFKEQLELSIEDIQALPALTMPVTMECAGNGRAGVSPRSHSMPWVYEAVSTSEWTGTKLAPLIEQACPKNDVVEISFTGADYGYDMGEPHFFGRSLTLAQIKELDILLVYAMNGAPLLPQHGAPLRIIVPGWYGMASVKWLTHIEALTKPYDGHQQVKTYQFKMHKDDPGIPIRNIRVKSLMVPPGVPDWSTRKRFVHAGEVNLVGRAWSGCGVPIETVEVEIAGQWRTAKLSEKNDRYAWQKWTYSWQAEPGVYVLRCRARDMNGNVQPLDPPWDQAGFANNAAQQVNVFVGLEKSKVGPLS
ncbi:MAG: molybdopterin-dependent oxidoreductase [Ascidiaceihabitans sp.]|jgi:DMSO/TMAO reductase YedYZ molybdopterin-dependent catalytic subunit|tara:strand:- start:1202 stop:2326 length:1125 start_codon:yes stop_codon:yes gene_type:complete